MDGAGQVHTDGGQGAEGWEQAGGGKGFSEAVGGPLSPGGHLSGGHSTGQGSERGQGSPLIFKGSVWGREVEGLEDAHTLKHT